MISILNVFLAAPSAGKCTRAIPDRRGALNLVGNLVAILRLLLTVLLPSITHPARIRWSFHEGIAIVHALSDAPLHLPPRIERNRSISLPELPEALLFVAIARLAIIHLLKESCIHALGCTINIADITSCLPQFTRGCDLVVTPSDVRRTPALASLASRKTRAESILLCGVNHTSLASTRT
jgi:hypothetical protein